MALTGVQSIVYGVEDLEKSIQFHVDFGLDLVDRDDRGADFALADGSRILIRRIDDESLPRDALTRPAVRKLVWRVDSEASLDALEKELGSDRAVERDADGVLNTVDDYGIALGFQVSETKPVSFEQVPVNTPTDIRRWNENRKWYEKASPQLIHHVGFALPDVDKLADFYVDRLNFRVTDISKGLAVFLLADGRQDHHSIFLIFSQIMGGGVLWDHVSYGVENVDELMTGANIMQRRGYSSFVGMGRHRISSAINYYVDNPAGGKSEYLTDTDYIDETWKPRLWDAAFGAFCWTAELCDFNRNEPPWDCTVIEGEVPRLGDFPVR